MESYYENSRDYLTDRKHKLDLNFLQLKTNRSLAEDSRPIELLHIFAEITRLMYGLRITNCKSGKDRTGVGITLEECMILQRYHNLPREMSQFVLDDLRRNGVRIDVVVKNVGKKRYAFNKIRYFLLPQVYRPPLDLCEDLQT